MRVQDSQTFSIIVPLFNEEENIEPLVEGLLKVVGRDPNFLELILVDDGSRDLTPQKAKKWTQKEPRIRLVRHERNKGLGAAIRSGLKTAKGAFVLYTDADLPFDFGLLPALFSAADEHTVIAGRRLNRGEGARRWFLTKGYNFTIRMLFGLDMKDANFACKIFPRRFAQQAVLESDGSFIDVEMLLETRRIGLQIREYPLVYYPRERGLSTLSRPRVIFFILREMFYYASRLSLNETGFPLKGWKILQKSLRPKTSE